MWVQILQPFGGAGIQYTPDDVVEMDDAEAAIRIAAGRVSAINGIDDNTAAIIALDTRLTTVESERVRSMGDYVPGADYERNDVVRDGLLLSIALVDTSDSPSIIFHGDAAYQIPDAPTWSTGQLTTESLTWAAEFAFQDFARVSRLRFWVPTAVATTMYQIRFYDTTDPNNPILVLQGVPFAGADTGVGWATFNVSPAIISAGDVLLVTVESWSTLGSSSFSGAYSVQQPNNAVAPLPGQIVHANKDLANLRVHKIDDDATDLSASLAGLEQGDHITYNGREFLIDGAPVDNGAWILFPVEPDSQAGAGLWTVLFEAFAAQPVDYVLLTDYWLNYSTAALSSVSGYVSASGGAVSEDSNAYGIDIETEGVSASDDWYLWATLSGDDVAVGTGGSAASITVTSIQSAYLSVEHLVPHTYAGVTDIATDLTAWDPNETRDFGGLDWGSVASKATIPSDGDYRLEASFIVEDGNNNVIGVEFVKDSGGGAEQLSFMQIEVAANEQYPLVLDNVETLAAGDLVWLRVYTDVAGAGADVEIHGGVAAIRAQWT